MATIGLSDITSAMATLFEDDLVALWNRSVVLSKLLTVQDAMSQDINWDVKDVDGADVASAVALAEGADVTSYTDDAIEKAHLSYTNQSVAFGISGLAINAARATGNPAQLADLFGEKMMDAVTRLAKTMNSEWYSGPGTTNRIMGLVDATNGALKATGTYGGISKSSRPLFAGNELLNGGNVRPNSFTLMRNVVKSIYTACGESPDLIVCDPIQWARYGNLFGDQRRWVSEATMASGKQVKFDGGFKALEFDGIPVIQDKDCPAGQMLFLNTRYVKIRQMNDTLSAEVAGGNYGKIRLTGTAEYQLGSGQTPLVARINPLARTGDSYKFQLILYPQLQVRRPNACAILGDLVSA